MYSTEDEEPKKKKQAHILLYCIFAIENQTHSDTYFRDYIICCFVGSPFCWSMLNSISFRVFAVYVSFEHGSWSYYETLSFLWFLPCDFSPNNFFAISLCRLYGKTIES